MCLIRRRGRYVCRVIRLSGNDDVSGLSIADRAEFNSTWSAEKSPAGILSSEIFPKNIWSKSMQYRRPQSAFVQEGCRRRHFVLLAVTRVAGYGPQGPCRPLSMHRNGLECGWACRVMSAVVALCKPKRVIFVTFTKIRGARKPSGTLAARAARSAA